MTATSPKVLCQWCFFNLTHRAALRFDLRRFRVRQALRPSAQQFLAHRTYFVDHPTLGFVRPLQVAAGIPVRPASARHAP